jgi:hypothetical protein
MRAGLLILGFMTTLLAFGAERPEAIESVVLVETGSGKICTGFMLSSRSLITSPDCAKEDTLAIDGYRTKKFKVVDAQLALVLFDFDLAKEIDKNKFLRVGKNPPKKPDELTFYNKDWKARKNTVSGENRNVVTLQEKDGDVTSTDYQGAPALDTSGDVVGVVVGTKDGVLTVKSLINKATLDSLVAAGVLKKEVLASLPPESPATPPIATQPPPIVRATPTPNAPEVLPAPAPSVTPAPPVVAVAPRVRAAPATPPPNPLLASPHILSVDIVGSGLETRYSSYPEQNWNSYFEKDASTWAACLAYLGTDVPKLWSERTGTVYETTRPVQVTWNPSTKVCRLYYVLPDGSAPTTAPTTPATATPSTPPTRFDNVGGPYRTHGGTRLSSHDRENYHAYYPETARSWEECNKYLNSDYEVAWSSSRGSETVRITQVEWSPKTGKCYLYYGFKSGSVSSYDDSSSSGWISLTPSLTVTPRTSPSYPPRLQRKLDRIRGR